MAHFFAALLTAACLLCPPAARAAEKDVLLSAMRAEMARSVNGLRKAEKVPLHFLSYQVRDTRNYDVGAFLGAVWSENERHTRSLDVDARVGSPRLDSTHQVKGGAEIEDARPETDDLVTDDDEASLRADIWLKTDAAFKAAYDRYARVETNKAMTAEETDTSDDFSVETPSKHVDRVVFPALDKTAWRERLRRLSLAFKPHPFVFDSFVSLSVRVENRYLVTSEGTEVVTGNRYIRLSYQVGSRTDDGMDLERYEGYDADRFEDLPSEAEVLADMERSVAELRALRAAPLTDPFTGPAIIRSRAAGVYFHEILGHRLEGHRQKMEDEGQTFTKMLGSEVTAPFLSVYDDATLDRFRGRFLRGFYRFDDEGIPSRRVNLIKDGVLKEFLLYRSPIKGFPKSNGHGRRSSGFPIVARMGNTVVEASKTMPYPELRARLIEEIKKRGKPYGLVFDDISGGYTGTGRRGPQSFKVLPLLVYRVYPDGRPDEVVRGVDIVGTPLTSFSKIVAAADDYDIFNGTCGAESGWVPVSAVAPSLLISEMEVEKRAKSSEKPPILKPPHHDGGTAK